jgi:hypothetical protein
VFRFPLLVLAAATSAWCFATDAISNGGNGAAWVTLVYGLVALVIALRANPVYAFWLHVVAGLTIGGAML